MGKLFLGCILYFYTIILALIISASNAIGCNLYPKILGGNLGNTVFTSLDTSLSNDLLTAGGYTNDYALANSLFSSTDNVPLIVAYSIRTR